MFKKIYTAAVLSAVLLFSGCQVNSTAALKEPVKIEAKKEKAAAIPLNTAAPKVKETKPVPPDASFSLAVSGDVMSHITNTESAQKSDGSYDYLPQFQEIQGLLSKADYTMVNLESTVAGEEYGYRGFPRFNAPVNLAETLKKIGVDLVVTANNHAMDSGIQGLKDNLDNLDRIGLEHTGTFRTREEASIPFVKDLNGIKVGFVAFSYGTNHIDVPNNYSLNLNSPDRIRKKIKEARDAGAELIVFHIHWGKEYTEYPSQVQMDLYKVLEEEGADIVIGSHPHRLQPMEMREIEYNGVKKTQAVIWSTGNLYQGGTREAEYTNIGSVFRLKVQRRNGVISVTDLNYDLVCNLRWDDANSRETYKLIPRSQMEQYKNTFRDAYQVMKKEFDWAAETLGKSVEVKFSDGTSSKSNLR